MTKNTDIIVKLNCLALIHEKGAKEAVLVYPELTSFINSSKNRNLEEVRKELELILYETKKK